MDRPVIAPSALRHGGSEETIVHVFNNPIRVEDLEEGLTMLIGPDSADNLYEIGVVSSDEIRWLSTPCQLVRSTSLSDAPQP